MARWKVDTPDEVEYLDADDVVWNGEGLLIARRRGVIVGMFARWNYAVLENDVD